MSQPGSRLHAVARTPRAEYLILDIETVPDASRWARPETPEGVDPPFPPTWAHRIVVLGYLWLDHEYRLSRLGVIGEHQPGGTAASGGNDDVERRLLESFSEIVGEKRPVIVTYNGRS